MRRLRPRFLLCLAMGLAACAPLWVVRYIPLQDLPTHFATLRTLCDLHNPEYHLEDYATNLSNTQYLSLYLVGMLLAKIVGVKLGLTLLISASLVGIVVTTYAIAEELGSDGRVSLLTIPILYNGLFILGFMQFIFAIPVMLATWLAALAFARRQDLRSGAALAFLEVVLFYSHLVPFAIGQLGVLIIVRPATWTRLRKFALAMIPIGLVLAHWLIVGAESKAIRATMTTSGTNVQVETAVKDFYSVSFDVFRDSADERHFLMGVLIAALVVAFAPPRRETHTTTTRMWLSLVPLSCLVLYFVSQDNNGYIFYIRQRYPVMFAFTALPLLPFVNRWKAWVATIALVLLDASSIESTTWHFRMFDRYELGDFDGAIAAIPKGKRVVSAIFDAESQYVRERPFVHFVNYYQLERGGDVFLSFAGLPHWPVTYAEHRTIDGLDTARLGLEWKPDRVAGDPYLDEKFDYVLTRGETFDPPQRYYRRVWAGDRWSVWQPREEERR
jgi:hypothetical protein